MRVCQRCAAPFSRTGGDPYCGPACRLWSRVTRCADVDCWPWVGGRAHPFGYGLIGLDGRPTTAHRVAWLVTRGPIPRGLSVLHRCDNPPCCNPAHLFLGTQADNMHDRHAKGRFARGSAVHSAKLTEDHVRAIRATYSVGIRGRGVRALATRYGVAKNAVRCVLARTTWAHIH